MQTDRDELKTAELTPKDAQQSETYDLKEPELSDAQGFPCFIDMKTGLVTPVDTKIFVCGFSSRCGLVIPQSPEHHTVSRFHATVTTEADGTMYITDESMNGTFFGTDPNDPASFRRLPKGNRVQLRDGQYLRFAFAMYLFKEGERMPR